MDPEATFDSLRTRDWETTDVEPLRMAIVGLGSFAQSRALPAIAAGDHCETTVLVSGSPDRRARLREEYDVEHGLSYEAFEDGAAADAYDAVFLPLPNALHLPYTRTAAELGKHVVCEKPMEAAADRAAEMVEVCEAAGVTLMVAYRLQTEPVVRRLRDRVQDGLLGEVVHLHGAFSTHILERDGPDQWRLDGETSGGGALADLGVYHVNTSRFLLGEDPVAVRGTTASPDAAFAEVDEHVSMELEFPGGATGAFTASFGAAHDSFVYLVGTEGTLLVEDIASLEARTVTIETGEDRLELPDVDVNEVVEEFDYFAHCVRTGTTPEPDGRDGHADMAVMAAVYEAAETGETVRVEYE